MKDSKYMTILISLVAALIMIIAIFMINSISLMVTYKNQVINQDMFASIQLKLYVITGMIIGFVLGLRIKLEIIRKK